MSLSLNAVKDLLVMSSNQSVGLELANILNTSSARQSQSTNPWQIAAAVVASHASATTDFSALMVGDIVVHIAAGAAPAAVNWATVVTAGTNPDGAGVIGDLYLALRASATPTPLTTVL